MSSGYDVLKDLLCGCMSGWGQVVTMMPFQNIKIKMISKPAEYHGYIQAFTKTIAEEGVLSFYKGMLMPLIGVGAQVGVQFGIVQTLKKRFVESYADSRGVLPYYFSFISGFIAGIPSALVSTPLDHARFRVALIKENGVGSVRMALNIYQQYGLAKLFLGFNSFALRECFGLAGYFGMYDFMIEKFRKDDKSLPIVGSLISGGCAGWAFWIGIYPVDYVKTLIQTDSLDKPRFKNAIHCGMEEIKRGGVKVLYTGFEIMMARAFVVNSFGFLCFQMGKKLTYGQ